MRFYYESIPNDENIPAKIYCGRGDDRHYPLHWHREPEFVLVTEGTLKATVSGENEIINEGDFLFVNSGDLHETDSEAVGDKGCIIILLSYRLAKEYCRNFDGMRFSFDGKPEAKSEAVQILKECGRLKMGNEKNRELELSIALRRLLLLLLNECECIERDTEREQKSLIPLKRAMGYIDENFSEEIRLSAIASEIGMAETYFCRYFKKMSGRTFHSYLNNVRLYHAYAKLTETDSTVTETALSCGFANVKSFIDCFKAAYGVTPDKYRQSRDK